MLIPIDEVVHIRDVVTHDPTTGGVTDADSAPTFDVFEEATDTPILDDQAMTKRTSMTGNYRGSFTASAANGFEAGKWYNVVVTATVGGITAKCVTNYFRCAPAESVAGVPKTDVSHVAGTSQTAGDIIGDTNDIQSRLPAALVSGRMDSSVGAMAANVLTATAINADAITAAKVAADVTTELQSGLATASALNTLTGYVDTEVAAVKAVTDKLDTMLQAASGSPGDWEFRADALRRAPTGSGGGGGGGPSETDIANAVWSWAGRTLTALDEDSTTIDLDNLIRSAIGLGSPNLDTQLGALPTAIENADTLLDRDMSSGTDSGSPTVRTPRQALRILRNKWSISGATQTITKEDDTTTSWTQVLSTTPGADPVTGVDPA